MQPNERWIIFTQVFALVSLGVACFLPFYTTAAGEVTYFNRWDIFLWIIPVIFILHAISNRWLKAIFGVLASIGGLYNLLLVTFAANFKSTPLVGFHIAQISIIILLICWLILIITAFVSNSPPKADASMQ